MERYVYRDCLPLYCKNDPIANGPLAKISLTIPPLCCHKLTLFLSQPKSTPSPDRWKVDPPPIVWLLAHVCQRVLFMLSFHSWDYSIAGHRLLGHGVFPRGPGRGWNLHHQLRSHQPKILPLLQEDLSLSQDTNVFNWNKKISMFRLQCIAFLILCWTLRKNCHSLEI